MFNPKKYKSQSAVEFIILSSFMLLVIVSFFAIVGSRFLEARDESNRQISQDIAEYAYNEIELAKSMNDGYTRLFKISKRINGIGYSIQIIDNRELIVNYRDQEHVQLLPINVSGNINTGLNEIKKTNGVIYLRNIPS